MHHVNYFVILLRSHASMFGNSSLRDTSVFFVYEINTLVVDRRCSVVES